MLAVSSTSTSPDSAAGRRPTSLLLKGHASVKMLHREGLARQPARACLDPLPPQTVCPSLLEVKYIVFPSGDQLAQSSAPASAIVIQALSGTGFGPSAPRMPSSLRILPLSPKMRRTVSGSRSSSFRPDAEGRVGIAGIRRIKAELQQHGLWATALVRSEERRVGE